MSVKETGKEYIYLYVRDISVFRRTVVKVLNIKCTFASSSDDVFFYFCPH